MSTVLDLIKGSLRKIGVLAEGETPSAQMSSDALRSLNMMLDSWNNQNLIVNGVVIESFPLVSGQATYTLGTGGDFDTTVPIRTDKAFIKLNDGSEYPVKMVDNNYWGNIQVKDTESIPDIIYINKNYPLKNVRLYPAPNESMTLCLHNYRQVSNFANLTDSLNVPIGHERAIEFNLSIELAPEYGAAPSADIYKIANEALANIKRTNITNTEIRVDGFLQNRTGFDWRIGE